MATWRKKTIQNYNLLERPQTADLLGMLNELNSCCWPWPSSAYIKSKIHIGRQRLWTFFTLGTSPNVALCISLIQHSIYSIYYCRKHIIFIESKIAGCFKILKVKCIFIFMIKFLIDKFDNFLSHFINRSSLQKVRVFFIMDHSTVHSKTDAAQSKSIAAVHRCSNKDDHFRWTWPWIAVHTTKYGFERSACWKRRLTFELSERSMRRKRVEGNGG